MGLRLLTSRAGLAILLIAGILPFNSFGQAPEVQFLSGTTFTDSTSGQTYAFLRMQSENPLLLRGLQASVHAKAGLAASPMPYSVVGGLSLQRRPAALRALADTFPTPLLDKAAFAEVVAELFGEFGSGAAIQTPDLLATVLQIAEVDDALYRRLLMLAYEEPYVAVSMGIAALVPMTAPVMTFEVRSGADGRMGSGPPTAIVGRVTLDSGQPLSLPAPPQPEQIADLSPTGHLNVKLRWGSNRPLERATPLVYGFDIFRIAGSLAEGRGYHTTPPTAQQMSELLRDEPASAQRLNSGAVLPVATDDLSQPFFIDDNEAAFGRGLPLEDGAVYYYYIAARDLLGRHGALSQGLQVTVCARFPPESPRALRLWNDRQYDAGNGNLDTRLELQWSPHASAEQSPPAGYYVYRWASVSEMQTTLDPAAMLSHRVSSLIAHVPGQARYSFRDAGPGAPQLPDDAGKTHWYSVRAVFNTACGEVESGDSSPAWGVLRDFRGPDSAASVINFSDSRPVIDYTDLSDINLTEAMAAEFVGPTGNVRHLRALVQTTTLAVNRFRIGIAVEDAQGNFVYRQVGAVEFTETMVPTAFNIRFPTRYLADTATERLWVEAMDTGGRTARAHAAFNNFPMEPTEVEVIAFELGLQTGGLTLVPGGTLPPGASHRPVNPLTGEINPLTLVIEVPDEAREFKAYKRVEGGPLVFFAQGTEIGAPGSIEEIHDTTFPPYGGEICYFIQWFDTHGNPSPLAALGCVAIGSRLPLPVPLLEQAQAAGTEDAAQAIVRWFCPPDGVERFRVYVGDGLDPVVTGAGASAPVSLSSVRYSIGSIGALPNPTPTLPPIGPPGVRIGDTQFFPVETGKVGSDFGNPFTPGQFEITLPVTPGTDYQFYVVAVGADGTESAPSNFVDFRWRTPPASVPPEIPWPAISMGAIDTDFLAAVNCHIIDAFPRFQGVAVQIGSFFGGETAIDYGGAYTLDNLQFSEPTTYADKPGIGIELFSTSDGETLLPCVLYRQQVDPDTGEPVTGDLVQVSPLIEDLLLRTDGVSYAIHNPFVDLYPTAGGVGVFIKDTQPVILGKTYRYHVVRLQANGEIDRVIALGPITVSANP